MPALTEAVLLVALGLCSGATDAATTQPTLEADTAATTIQLDERATLSDSILGEDPALSDFVRRVV